MSTSTEKIGLIKPDIEDFYDIGVSNDNMDKIDTEIGGVKNPGYQIPGTTDELVSGESLFKAFGKLARAVKDFIIHKTLLATQKIDGHMSAADKTKLDGVATAATKSPITNSAAVTMAGSYALDAVHANAAVAGSLANKISALNTELAQKSKIKSKTYNVYCSGGNTATQTLAGEGISSDCVIPIIINCSSANWDQTVSYQESNGLIVVSGMGVATGYYTTVKVYYT